ncbi:conjugal transfer protein TraB [Halobacteriales archaeon QS_3_64_16]|nr:MAG: conjugal transfer protein TraB [Halobacteriales archaeon QS_3_64_16]
MSDRAVSSASEPPPDASEESGRVHVVGTAHVSAESVTEVEETIEERRPDVVAVELDEGRYRQLKGQTPDDLDAGDLLRGNTVFQFLAYWVLSYVQMRMGDRFDITPGADMLAAVETAEELGLGVALIDRDIQVTIQRFWSRMTVLEKLRMIGSLPLALVGIGGSGSGEEKDEEDFEEFDVDSLTDADVVTAMIEEFRHFSPGGAEALIDERDAVIAYRLVGLREAGHEVVAIVGAGHREGIERYLENSEELPPIESLMGAHERRFSVYKVLGYTFTLGFLAFFVLVAMAGARNELLFRLFGAWFLVNGIFAAGLARLAGAHLTSALTGGALAWLTSVNPLLAPGWFAGYVELRYLDVNVKDIGTLNDLLSDEEQPLAELYRRMTAVPLFRLILVVALTNIGSIVASFLFVIVVLPYLAADVGGVDGIVRLMLQGAQNSADLIRATLT